MSLEEVQAILDNDRSKEAWGLLNQKEMQIAEQELENSSLEEITERLKAEPNDRVDLKMYVLKVEKLASDSLEEDPQKSFDLIQEGMEFYLEQADKLKPDLGLKFYNLTQEKWEPISDQAEAKIFAEDEASEGDSDESSGESESADSE